MSTLYGADSGDSKLPEVFRAEDLLWEVKLGTHQYTIPRVDGDRIYLGVNDMYLKHPAAKRDGGGILMCLEKATGEMMWQLPIPKYEQGRQAPYHFNIWKCGVCSTPAVEGKRIYIVGPRGDVLCLDRNGQADGKVYVSTEKNSLWVMKAGREKQVLNQCRLTSVGITPMVQNGVFYFPTQKRLFALKLKSETQANLHIKKDPFP